MIYTLSTEIMYERVVGVLSQPVPAINYNLQLNYEPLSRINVDFHINKNLMNVPDHLGNI